MEHDLGGIDLHGALRGAATARFQGILTLQALEEGTDCRILEQELRQVVARQVRPSGTSRNLLHLVLRQHVLGQVRLR